MKTGIQGEPTNASREGARTTRRAEGGHERRTEERIRRCAVAAECGWRVAAAARQTDADHHPVIESLGRLAAVLLQQPAQPLPTRLPHKHFGLRCDPGLVRMEGGRRENHAARLDMQEGDDKRLLNSFGSQHFLTEEVALPEAG
jgi:hypothetical protein